MGRLKDFLIWHFQTESMGNRADISGMAPSTARVELYGSTGYGVELKNSRHRKRGKEKKILYNIFFIFFDKK
jgi:hypothetical protein